MAPLPTLGQRQADGASLGPQFLHWAKESPTYVDILLHTIVRCSAEGPLGSFLKGITGCAWTPRGQTGMEKGFTAYRLHLCWWWCKQRSQLWLHLARELSEQLCFKPTFSLSCFTFIKKLFSSSSLSAIRVVSSSYLRLFCNPECCCYC